jgi:putative Mg2+ transporter-C (MgtC) family protein
MDILMNELANGLPDTTQGIRLVTRLTIATLLGAVVGYERERTGKDAGLRTHMLVALSCALLVLAPLESGMSPSDVSRIIQGVAAGIGFIGAGTILKRSHEAEVVGLTTAAGIWLTAAIGLAAGLGRIGLAMIAAAFAWTILAVMARFTTKQ